MNNIQLLTCEVHERALPKRSWDTREMKGYNSKPRIYVSPAGESFWDNLTKRKQRPSTMYRQLAVAAALRTLGLPVDTKISWSQYAGCTRCPCSPGFIVQAHGIPKNVWCTIGDPVDVAALAAKRMQATVEQDRDRLVMNFAD